MEVILSSGGMGYGHHWARGIQKAGYLKRLITTLDFKNKPGVDSEKVQRIFLPELIGHFLWRLPGANSLYFAYQVRDTLYDRMSEKYLDGGDIFHVFNHFGLSTMRKAQLMGMKTIVERDSAHPVTVHQILTEEYARYGLAFPQKNEDLIPRHVTEFEEADRITVPSNFVWRTMIEEGIPEEKLRKVSLGFSPQAFERRPEAKIDDVFRVITVGALSLQKGMQYLLEGFKQANLPNAELILVGGTFPDSRAFLGQYEGIFKHIKFVPQEKLVELYNQSSVFVLPSVQDGCPQVVFEAAACGLPIIISENVGTDFRRDEDCFIVPIRDPKAIAERLTQLYEDESLRRTMAESAYGYVQQFTWDASFDKLIAVYDELMA